MTTENSTESAGLDDYYVTWLKLSELWIVDEVEVVLDPHHHEDFAE